MAKYTQEALEPLVKAHTSVKQVMQALGLKFTGGGHGHLTRVIRGLGLDTSHFTGQGYLRGVPSPNKRPWQDVLVMDLHKGRRESPAKLRWALEESGVPYVCKECGQIPVWNGKPLRIQVDHIDGNPVNNVRENLRFICPNCHTQTATFGVLNSKVPRKEKVVRGPWGGSRGPQPHRRKVDYDAVRLRYAEVGIATIVGEEFGISGVMVKKIVRSTE